VKRSRTQHASTQEQSPDFLVLGAAAAGSWQKLHCCCRPVAATHMLLETNRLLLHLLRHVMCFIAVLLWLLLLQAAGRG
jgi:hypothetical protein